MLISTFIALGYFVSKEAYNFAFVFIPILSIYIKRQISYIRKIIKVTSLLYAIQLRRKALSRIYANEIPISSLKIKLIEQIKNGIDNLLQCLFWLSLMICPYFKVPYSYMNTLLFVALLSRYLFIYQIKDEFNGIYNKIFLILRIHVIAFFVTYFLKVDKLVKFKWEISIWPLYILCAFSFLLSLTSLIICVGTIILSLIKENRNLNRRQTDANVCLGFWLFYTINGFGVSLLLTIMRGLRYLNNDKNMEEIQKCYIPLYSQVYLLGLILISLINTKLMQDWIFENILKQQCLNEIQLQQQYLADMEEQIIDQRRRIQQSDLNINDQSLENQIQSSRDNCESQQTPRFLMVVSGSYFKTLKEYSKVFLGQLKTIGKANKIKQEKERVEFGFEKHMVKQKNKRKQFDAKIKEIIESKKKQQKHPICRNGSIIIDEKMCFTDQNESQNVGNQNSSIQPIMNRSEFKSYTPDKYLSKYTVPNSHNDLIQPTDPHASYFHQHNTLQTQTKMTVAQIHQVFFDKQEKDKFKERLSSRGEICRKNDIQCNIIQARELLRDQLGNNLKVSPEEGTNINKLCVICLENKPNGVIMNCGHGGICFKCGTKMCQNRNRNERKCHLCRKKIRKLLKIDIDKLSGNIIPILGYLDLKQNPPFYKKNPQRKSKSTLIDNLLMSIREEIESNTGIRLFALEPHSMNQVMLHGQGPNEEDRDSLLFESEHESEPPSRRNSEIFPNQNVEFFHLQQLTCPEITEADIEQESQN